jgi:hypothetical protein
MGLAKRTFALAAAGAVTAYTGPGAFFGIHVRENTGVAAPGTLQVYDNTAASGTLVATIRLGADGESNFEWHKGVKFQNGLHIVATAADLTGMILVGSGGGLRALPFAGADLLLLTGATEVDSVLAAETAGAAAEWRVFDALTATGTSFVGGINTANETQKVSFSKGVTMGTGLFYDQVSGAVSGNVYVR